MLTIWLWFLVHGKYARMVFFKMYAYGICLHMGFTNSMHTQVFNSNHAGMGTNI